MRLGDNPVSFAETHMPRFLLAFLLSVLASPALALLPPCNSGRVWEDSNGNGRFDPDEKPLQGIKLSDGETIVYSDENGQYDFPVIDGRTVFVIKPPTHDFPAHANGLPDFWRHVRTEAGPELRFGGIASEFPACRDFGLLPRADAEAGQPLEMLVFADSQTSSLREVDFYRRDIVEPLVGRHGARLGTTLGDITNDDLSLYPALVEVTTKLGVPWLHVPGNHDIDFDAPADEDSLLSFRRHFGPDTFAWEEPRMTFIGLDDVIYLPGQRPAYIGGFREDQFTFLEAYLPTVPKDRLLVIGVHIPFFDDEGRETFRRADRERLFGLLADFPHVLLLSAHSHTQRHWYHGADTGWHGAMPLHEFNVGAACGAYWSGVEDEAGIPDATMADGTPNGFATLVARAGGDYALAWHVAREPDSPGIALHAPRVLRQGAYPAWGIFANVFMGDESTPVEYRVDGGEWRPMQKVLQPDPRVMVENVADDVAETLRGFDRSPEASPSHHLWRAALPTRIEAGEHVVEVRALDRWRGELRAQLRYRLDAVE